MRAKGLAHRNVVEEEDDDEVGGADSGSGGGGRVGASLEEGGVLPGRAVPYGRDVAGFERAGGEGPAHRAVTEEGDRKSHVFIEGALLGLRQYALFTAVLTCGLVRGKFYRRRHGRR